MSIQLHRLLVLADEFFTSPAAFMGIVRPSQLGWGFRSTTKSCLSFYLIAFLSKFPSDSQSANREQHGTNHRTQRHDTTALLFFNLKIFFYLERAYTCYYVHKPDLFFWARYNLIDNPYKRLYIQTLYRHNLFMFYDHYACMCAQTMMRVHRGQGDHNVSTCLHASQSSVSVTTTADLMKVS